jgi:hypothetical protein
LSEDRKIGGKGLVESRGNSGRFRCNRWRFAREWVEERANDGEIDGNFRFNFSFFKKIIIINKLKKNKEKTIFLTKKKNEKLTENYI